MNLQAVWEAVILGILQGLTEFLPISSSAHLILLPWLLGWQPFGLVFDVMIHGGTLLAVLFYFRNDLQILTLTFMRKLRGFSGGDDGDQGLAEAILLGTVPAVLAGLALQPLIERFGRTPAVTVVTLSLFGLFLWWSDMRGRKERNLLSIRPREGFLIGLAQSMALIPGVSRSGVTITAALLLGLSRPDAARFSFLLGIPVIFLAALKGVWDLLGGTETAGNLSVSVLLAGVTASFVTGFLCIKYFLQFLRFGSYIGFAFYRFLLAAVILFLLSGFFPT